MKEWLERAEISLAMAMKAVDVAGGIPRENMYMLAPLFYSKISHMNNDNLIDEMVAVNEVLFKRDCSHDENSKHQYKFHYVSSYLYCYVVAGKIDEKEYDRVMDYLNGEMDLF
ncbi:MAG: hypothetical protein P1U67_09075 [Alcanivoracaceae bacterium]|nr:hypothetical protein [Alcanivoracaceae bacterium]